MDTTKYLTQEKFEEMQKELQELRTVKRKEVAQSLEYARALGDLSENTEYQEARESQAMVEDRIATLENLLKNASIVKEMKSDVVVMGSTVSIERADGSGAAQTYKLVGSDEVNMAEGKISNISPLGAALFGKKRGETASVKTPKGETKYKIVSVK